MKSLNKFKHYISQNKIIILTIHPNVKSYILLGEMDSSRTRWITKILKYDVEIYPTKVVRERALCKQLAKDQRPEHIMIIKVENKNEELMEVLEETKNWITLCIYFDNGRLTSRINASQRIRLRINSLNYYKIDDVLYRKNHDGMLSRCIYLEKISKVLKEFHSVFFEGHYSGYTIVVIFYRHVFIGLPCTQIHFKLLKNMINITYLWEGEEWYPCHYNLS